ncbi:MAG: hypothetical protein QM764_24585 [Chitinophagaceae bacterium]
MGFTVAYARVDAAIEDTRYTIRVTGENTGLADLFGSLTLDATASGAFPGRIIVPTDFETRNLDDGAPRQTRVVWTGADANPEIITPSLEVEDPHAHSRRGARGCARSHQRRSPMASRRAGAALAT